MKTNFQTFFRNLETSGEAFGEINYRIVSANGFGLNPTDILTGKVKAPANGTRICLDLHGEMTGTLEGTFNGTDYMNVLPSGETTSNIHGVIVTGDGQKIAVKILGETTSEGRTLQHLALRHNGETMNWVNARHIFAKGDSDRTRRESSLKLFAVDDPPFGAGKPFFAGGKAFIDPDDSAVNYANFPFTLDQLKGDAAATIIYTGEGHLNSVEAFGVDVGAVFSGQVPIPEEGLRLNGFFSGPVAGSVNGVISGRNFLRVMPDGSMRMNSKIIVNTLEGETLLLEALGASFPQTGTAWFETSRAVSNLERYAQLTALWNVGVGSTDVTSRQIIYNHFGYKNDPFRT